MTMDAQGSSSSRALIRKREDNQLMPPPPPTKKIKRPRKILDEESYTEALSHIIARDFFPGLLETETKQEYLDALQSQDPAWIASASRRLQHVMTPGRSQSQPETIPSTDTGRTPRNYVGDTPASQVSVPPAQPRMDRNMSLNAFQSTYTSEDNESFYKLVDKQNQKKAEKYAWLWRGNKLASKQMIKQKEVEDKLSRTRGLIDDGFGKKDRLAIRDSDDRPAMPDTWASRPRNGLMFEPDDPEVTGPPVAQKSDQPSKMATNDIVYENTRLQSPHHPSTQRPPSPTSSSIRDAIAGHHRSGYQDSSMVGGDETPRVNGYSFVEEGNDEDEDLSKPLPEIDLGPGDEHNPFRIQDQRDRETLHERMVDRISKSKRDSVKHGYTGRIERTPAPKFPSSPRVGGSLTPAAQRLWNQIGTPKAKSAGGSFGQTSKTPRLTRPSRLRSVQR